MGQTASKPYVVVVGGANMDIAGRPHSTLVPHDSNIGTVRLSPGGVGRNIAHNLALMGVDVRLVTAFGEDAQAAPLIEGCRSAGINIRHSLVVPGGTTSTYLFVMDERGETQVAINDMRILEHLTRQELEQRQELLRGAALCFVDTNLPADTVRWLCQNVHVPLFCDPISTAKAGRLKGVVGRLHTLKPNRMEAELLSGVPIRSEADLRTAAHRLLGTGLRRLYISLGPRGVYCADHDYAELIPPLAGKVVNTNGAGDAMAAAIAWAYLNHMDLRQSAHAGLAAASLAVRAEGTISPRVSAQALQDLIRTFDARP